MAALGCNDDPMSPTPIRITVGGARPTDLPINKVIGGQTPAQYEAFVPHIGENWAADTTGPTVEYPATVGILRGAPTVNQSVAIGAERTIELIRDATGPVVVAGLSEGGMVADEVARRLAGNPDAPPAESLTFVVFGSPGRGLLRKMVPYGVHVPLIGYTQRHPPAGQYDTSYVIGEYDGWADPPDRLWNLVAGLNAVMGAAQVHVASALAHPDHAVKTAESVTALGGTVRHYLVPTRHLPLTKPLRDAGVSAGFVDRVERVLRRVVDAGYRRNDPGHRAGSRI